MLFSLLESYGLVDLELIAKFLKAGKIGGQEQLITYVSFNHV